MNGRDVIFVNGELSFPELLLEEIRPDDRIICADGGVNHALSIGLKPHALIGDMDSASSSSLRFCVDNNVVVERHPREKDATDLELAIEYSLKSAPREIVFVTALGGRLDHLLGNILLLSSPRLKDVSAKIIDGHSTAAILKGGSKLSLDGLLNATLSLLPISEKVSGINLNGAKWPLTDDSLVLGSNRGVSNIIVSATAELSVGEGTIFLLIDKTKC